MRSPVTVGKKILKHLNILDANMVIESPTLTPLFDNDSL